MKAIAEIRLLPVNGDNVSAQAEIECAQDILVTSGLEVVVHAQSTDIEGELEDVFDTLKQLHMYLDHCNILRLSTIVRLENGQERGASVTPGLGWTCEQSNRARSFETSQMPSISDGAISDSAPAGGSDSFVTVWQIASPMS